MMANFLQLNLYLFLHQSLMIRPNWCFSNIQLSNYIVKIFLFVCLLSINYYILFLNDNKLKNAECLHFIDCLFGLLNAIRYSLNSIPMMISFDSTSHGQLPNCNVIHFNCHRNLIFPLCKVSQLSTLNL